ncbi:DUF2809 domain-containing protein [Salinimicrobium sp. GXAS 041]|uniref:ribosomal maturation YjgA family protein n=1 Tax=Salinimicrobium sp. GXAS 041 TaxID=3400806 RepID=UPI003C756792
MSPLNLKLDKAYLFATILLFITEVVIALFVRDKIVRPYVGDFLVVMLLYTFLRSFFRVSVLKAVLIALLFSYFIEILQYLNLTGLPGLEHKKIVLVVLGSHFEWIDMFIYTCSAATIYVFETYGRKIQDKPGNQFLV